MVDLILMGAFALLLGAVMLTGLYLQIMGIIHSFKKAWYIGLVAVLVPLFALFVGTAKEVFDTDILNA